MKKSKTCLAGRRVKNQKPKLKREFSAGCVVYKQTKVQSSKFKVQYLLGKHSGYHKWVLPKGLIEEGEKSWQTALRETEEETGVRARLVEPKPIHKEQYFFYATYKDFKGIADFSPRSKNDQSTRRVAKYQEQGGGKTKVLKTVSFYLAEHISGDPEKDHGWEMEAAGWFTYQQALAKMAFQGEKEVLEKAKKKIRELNGQPKLLI